MAGKLAVPALLGQALRFCRGLFLFSMSAAGSAVAAAGLGLLGYLLLSRALTPPQVLHTRTLYLDYSASDIIAQAAFLPPGELSDGVPTGLPPGTRFLAPGQRVDVWLDLQLPPPTSAPSARGSCNGGGMAQVVAELVTLDGKTLARASRPLLLRQGGNTLWTVLTAPLRWVGLADGSKEVRVELFKNFREVDKAPFTVFQVAIKTRDPGWAPELLSAQVSVRLRMGLLRSILYTLRPGTLLMLLLGGSALACLLGGSTAAAVCFALWLYTLWGAYRSEGAAEKAAGEAGEGSEAGSSVLSGVDGEEITSSLNELSEVDSVGRGGGGEAVEGPSSSHAHWPPEGLGEEAEDWQEVEPAPALARGGRGWERGKGASAGPALSANDTAFAGSERPTSAAVQEGLGLMRRRAAHTGGKGGL